MNSLPKVAFSPPIQYIPINGNPVAGTKHGTVDKTMT